MKKIHTRILFKITSLLLLGAAFHLKAASGAWTGATDATWAGANWSASPVPGTGDTATFNGAGNANTTISLGSGVTILDILFNSSGAAAYTIGSGSVGSQTLTLGNSGGIAMSSTVANNQLFNAAITLGTDITAQTYSLTNNSGYALTLAGNVTGAASGGTAGVKTLVVTGSGNTTVGGIIAKGGASNVAVTKNGTGTLTLNNANTFTGATTVNAGTLGLNFTASGAPTANILATGSALALAGGTLNVIGASSSTAQTVAGATFNAGCSGISANGSATLTLGALTPVIGGAVMFTGPATTTYSGGNSATPTTVAATATITTTTAGVGTLGLIVGGAPPPTLGAYATVGLYDWAATNAGGPPGTIIGGSRVAGFYGNTYVSGVNLDTPAAGLVNNGTTTWGAIRFNTPSATANTPTFVSGNGNIQCPGVLVTPNMGAQNAGLSGTGTWSPYYGTTAGKTNTMQIWQNNTLGYFLFDAAYYNGRSSSPSINGLVQNGPGTVVYANVNTETAPTWLNGGCAVIGGDSAFGTPSTAAAVYLNGGTVVATNTLALDNGGGANPRPITLLANGGGLAAAAGLTLTVDGQIGSAANAGPLVIGIPASTANGNNTSGLLPGTGAGTANTTPVYATGTVALTYPNAGNGNFQYGGTLITGGATLAINSQYALGGGDQGPTIFNGGTLQYTATLATGAAGSALDISGQPVTLTGNATIDVNGHSVTYANPIGNGGSGNLTLASTIPNGALTLSATAANGYTGNTIINGGALNLTGTLTGSGSVTVNGGTLEGNGTIGASSTVTLNGGTIAPGATASGNGTIGNLTVGTLTLTSGSINFAFSGTPANDKIIASTAFNGAALASSSAGLFNFYQAGGTTIFNTVGTYTLITYAGSDPSLDASWTTASASNPHVVNRAAGYTYQFAASGGALTVTIVAAASIDVWNLATAGNWSVAGNWTATIGSAPPSHASDTATFDSGAATSLNTVTLDANETVGAINMNNASSYVVADGGLGKTLTLDASGSGASVAVTAGAANAISAKVSLNDNATVTVSSGQSLNLSGVVANTSASKTLTLNGAGTTILGNANTYGPTSGSTGTTLSGGTLQLGNSAALSTGDVNLTGSGTLQAGAASLSVANNIAVGISQTATVDNNTYGIGLGGVISGSGALNVINSGTTTLGGANTYTGGTTINAGVVSISADGASPSTAGNLGKVPTTATANNVILNGGDLSASATLALHANRGIGIGATSGSTAATGLIDAAGGSTTLTVNGIIASAGTSGAANLTFNSVAGTPGTVVLNAANTFNGTTTIGAGTLTLGNSLALQNSTLAYNSGTLSFGALTAATIPGINGSQNLALANATAAAVALTIGSNNVSSTLTGTLNGSGSLIKTGIGTFVIGSSSSGGAGYSGSTLIDAGTLTLDGNGSVSMNAGANNIQLSGSLGVCTLNLVDSAAVTTTGGVYLGSEPTGGSDGGNGYPSGCTLTVQNNSSLSAASLSYGGVGASTRLPNCTLTVANSGLVSISGAFELGNVAGSATPTGTINLNGGTLAVGSFIFSSPSGTRPFAIHLNGGTLKANSSTTAFLPVFTDTAVDVDSGGAVINPSGQVITIAAALVHGTGTTDGGLTLNGAGTLTLTGVNTYNGPTAVSNGTMVVNGSIGTNSVTVTNAILGGVGTISGQTTLQPNAVLAAGTNYVGTLTFTTNLTLNALSTNIFAVTTAGGASNHVAVAGVLLPNSSVIKIISGTALHHCTNTLFTYNATVNNPVSGSFNATPVFDVTPPAGGMIVDDGVGHITLAVSNIPPVAGASFTIGATIGVPVTVPIVGGKYAPTDADGDTLSLTGVSVPANGTATISGTNIIYTATSGTSDSFTYTVSDPYGATASQTVNVTINSTGASFNQLSAPVNIGGTTWSVTYAGIPNYNYALDTTSSLTPPVTWTPVVTNAAASNGQIIFNFDASMGQGFFRTRSVP
jgi:autotransporter-associated beta strand protein